MGSIKTHQNQPKAAQTSPKQPKLVKNPSKNYLLVFWAPLNLIKISPKQPKLAQTSPK